MKLICPRCNSDHTSRRFTSPLTKYDGEAVEEVMTGAIVPTDDDEYRVYYDTSVCLDCGYWDWFQAASEAW